MAISNYLPSKKFTKILLIILAVGIIIFIISKRNSLGNLKSSKKTLSLTPEQIIEGDRDEDGVRDWEESLWGTNPDSKDTNNDGVSDLEEIESRRKEIALKQGIQLDENSENLNETDIFSRDIFASIISLKEKGLLTQDAVKQLAEAAGKSFTGKVEIEDKTTSDSLKAVSDTPENRKIYIKQIDVLLAEYWKKGINQEFKIFSTYSETQNPEVLADLSQIATTYEELSNALIKIPVPTSLKISHRDLINITYKMNVALKNVSQAETNEIMSAVGITQYKDQTIEFSRIINVYTVLVNQYGTL
jgi:hypothetical protein